MTLSFAHTGLTARHVHLTSFHYTPDGWHVGHLLCILIYLSEWCDGLAICKLFWDPLWFRSSHRLLQRSRCDTWRFRESHDTRGVLQGTSSYTISIWDDDMIWFYMVSHISWHHTLLENALDQLTRRYSRLGMTTPRGRISLLWIWVEQT